MAGGWNVIYLHCSGLSMAIRRTRCMACRRFIVSGEYRLGIPSEKMFKKKDASTMQKAILRYVCLNCGLQELTDTIAKARKYRKAVKRRLRADKGFYATVQLGPEFEEKARFMLKGRVDKKRAQSYNRRVKRKKLEEEMRRATAERLADKDKEIAKWI